MSWMARRKFLSPFQMVAASMSSMFLSTANGTSRLCKLTPIALYVPQMGISESVIIGEWAIALGNPFGLHFEDLNPTATVGVISAVDRIVRPEQNARAHKGMIQTGRFD